MIGGVMPNEGTVINPGDPGYEEAQAEALKAKEEYLREAAESEEE